MENTMETPKEKANELVNKYKNYLIESDSHSALGIELDLATISVEEIIKELIECGEVWMKSRITFWKDVLTELNKL